MQIVNRPYGITKNEVCGSWVRDHMGHGSHIHGSHGPWINIGDPFSSLQQSAHIIVHIAGDPQVEIPKVKLAANSQFD